VYCDRRSRLDLDHRHVRPNRMEDVSDRVTMSFDDDYDRHNKDDRDYLFEFPNPMVTKSRNK